MILTVILCLDDRGGMIFNNRRQSRDREVLFDISKMADKEILISPFSEKLFAEHNMRYKVKEDLPDSAEENDIIFVEDIDIEPYISHIDKIIIYKWNRTYPFDKCFSADLGAEGFTLTNTEELKGFSHEKITKETYEK